MNALHDMHCHLDFMSNAEEVATDAAAYGSLLFANTVTPDGWKKARDRFAASDNVVVGFGAHPWWAGEVDGVDSLLETADPRFIGEIGLDFGKRHAATAELQIGIFETMATWAARRGNRVLSLHSANAAREVLDTLEHTGALESCTCVFHWYSGPSDQLKRAIDAGCFFSVGPRMLATGKGREYVKAIPANRLMLETDDPPHEGKPYSYDLLHGNLRTAAKTIADIRGYEILEHVESTSRKLLGK